MHLLQYVDGTILLRVASSPISGQLLSFHLVQNDLTECTTIFFRVKYSNLAFKILCKHIACIF